MIGGVDCYCLLPKYCTLHVRDWKSTWCTWCYPDPLSIWACVWKHMKTKNKKTFDANILSNITYQLYIPKDLLCIFNFPSSLSVFVPSPCGQIYVSTVYHKNNRYCWWLLLALSWGNRLKSIGLVNKVGPDNHGWPFTNDIFKCVLLKDMFCILFNFHRIWLLLSN